MQVVKRKRELRKAAMHQQPPWAVAKCLVDREATQVNGCICGQAHDVVSSSTPLFFVLSQEGHVPISFRRKGTRMQLCQRCKSYSSHGYRPFDFFLCKSCLKSKVCVKDTSNDVDDRSTRMYLAISRGDCQTVNEVLNKSPSLLNLSHSDRCFKRPPPLISACYHGKIDVALHLLSLGACPEQHWLGLNAENWACYMGHQQLGLHLYRCVRGLHLEHTVLPMRTGPNRLINAPWPVTRCNKTSPLVDSLGADCMVCVLQFLPDNFLLVASAVCTEWLLIIEGLEVCMKSCRVRNQPVDEVCAFELPDLLEGVDYYGKCLHGSGI